MKQKLLFTAILCALSATAAIYHPEPQNPKFLRNRAIRQEKLKTNENKTLTDTALRLETPKRFTVQKAQAEMLDVVRLVAYSETVENNKTNYTYSWDQYGFPSRLDTDKGEYITFDYTWKVPGSVWSEKRVVKHEKDGTLSVLTDIKRTFHPNGSVASSDEGEHYYEYDEDGYMTRDTRFGTYLDDEGKVQTWSYTNTWLYVPLIDEWIVGYENASLKTIHYLDGENGYFTEEWESDETGKLVLKSITRKQFGSNGELLAWYTIDYETVDGVLSVSRCQGEREVYKSDPDGSKIVLIQEPRRENGELVWQDYMKQIYSPNFDNPLVFTPGEERIETIYDLDRKNEWSVYREYKYVWVSEKVIKYIRYNRESYSKYQYNYYLADSTKAIGELDEVADYNDENGNYLIITYDNYNGKTSDWKFYDKSGNLVKLMRSNSQTQYYDDFWVVPNSFEVWTGSNWEKCTDDIILTDMHYTLDSVGRVVKIVDSSSSQLYVNEWEYQENGLTFTQYIGDSDDNLNLESKCIIEVADGIETDTYFEERYGVFGYAKKAVMDFNKFLLTYYYKSPEDDDWTLNSYFPIITKEDNMDFYLVISRNVDDNGNVTNDTKRISKYWGIYERPEYADVYKMEEVYTWSAEKNDWVAESKYEYIPRQTAPVNISYPENPENVIDEYFTSVPTENLNQLDQWERARFYWDEEANDWKKNDFWLHIYTQPDPYTLKCSYQNDWQETEYDHNYRAVADTDHYFTSSYDIKQTWSYFGNDNVATRSYMSSKDNKQYTYVYRYDTIRILDSIEEFERDGNKFTVYNLQGMPVIVNGEASELLSLPKGIYIVNGKKIAL